MKEHRGRKWRRGGGGIEEMKIGQNRKQKEEEESTLGSRGRGRGITGSGVWHRLIKDEHKFKISLGR